MDKKNGRKTALRAWLWISVIAAVTGAALLYPIGSAPLNVLFFLIKAGMVAGLLTMLRGSLSSGSRLWTVCSGLAVLMTIMKWAHAGHAEPIFILAIITDIVMPSVACRLQRED